MEPVYRPVIGFALSLIRVMDWNVIVRGTEHVPAAGGAVIATNHVGYLDFVFVGYAALERGRLVRFLAKKEVFDHRVSGPLMRGMAHIPVDRFGRAGDALDRSAEALRRGEIVGMFPEATISRSFVPREGKSGAARMAMMAGAPLLPGAVWGTQRILTKDRPRNYQRHLTITVDFAAPISYDHDEDPAAVTSRLMKSVERLVDTSQRTYPDAPAGEDDRWWLPAHLGGSAPTVAEADALAERDRQERAARRGEELSGP
ncbi:MAG: lysophospholipid acyltransferase family protein [Actinomycetota bacterium]